MTFSEKSETLKPKDCYLLHPNFWGALYITCCGVNSSSAIIDCSSAWLTPFVAAINLGVPYLNLEYIPNRFTALKTAAFAPTVRLIAGNATSEEIAKFISSFKKLQLRYVKEAEKKIPGKFHFVF
jgi:hypothetical protein